MEELEFKKKTVNGTSNAKEHKQKVIMKKKISQQENTSDTFFMPIG